MTTFQILLLLVPCSILVQCHPKGCISRGRYKVECTGYVDFSSAFTNPQSITTVIVKDFTIERIHLGSFSGLTHISQVKFERGYINRISSNAFDGMTGDEHSTRTGIIFDKVNITTIDNGGFAGLQNIHYLDILNSEIYKVSKKAFSHSTIDDIFFHQTNIHSFAPHAFGIWLKTTSIYFYQVTMKKMPNDFIDGFVLRDRQQRFIIEDSTIGTISVNAFAGIHNATILIDNCEIKEISTDAFSKGESVFKVSIIGNDIGTIQSEIFGSLAAGPSASSSVIIDGNTIDNIKSRAFKGLDSYTYFFFRDNNVQCIEEGGMADIESMHVIGVTEYEIYNESCGN